MITQKLEFESNSRVPVLGTRITLPKQQRTKEDRYFVSALARGLKVLTCFRSGDDLLGKGLDCQIMVVVPVSAGAAWASG